MDSSLKGFLSTLSKISPFEPTFISAICIWHPSGCIISSSCFAPHRGNQSKPGIGILLSVTGRAILDLVLRATFGVYSCRGFPGAYQHYRPQLPCMSDPDYMPDLSTVNKTKSTDTLTVIQSSRDLVKHMNTIT